MGGPAVTMTLLAAVGVLLVALVVRALWLAVALRDAEDAHAATGEWARQYETVDLDAPSGPHAGYTAGDVLDSMRRHPSAGGLPWYTQADVAPIVPPLGEDATYRGPNLRARARVVFASVQDGHLLLDCVLAEDDDADPHIRAGLPITLSLGALETPWLAVHVEAMLERWAEGERVIDLQLLDSPIGGRATLVSASSRLVLPLTTVAGLD